MKIGYCETYTYAYLLKLEREFLKGETFSFEMKKLSYDITCFMKNVLQLKNYLPVGPSGASKLSSMKAIDDGEKTIEYSEKKTDTASEESGPASKESDFAPEESGLPMKKKKREQHGATIKCSWIGMESSQV